MTVVEPVAVDRRGDVVVARLNRPADLNAINAAMLEALLDLAQDVRRDSEVGCVIVTGTPRLDGRPCFSAGDDLKEAAAGRTPKGNPGLRLTGLIDDMLVPWIAAIDGICTTGALELALACDLRVVADSAEISDWHLGRLGSGLGGWGASTRLARLVGVAQAKDLILTGKVIDGEEALRVGLAQRLTPSERLMDEAMAMARAVAAMPRSGLRMTMAHLSRVEDLSKEEALSFAGQVREWFPTGRPLEASARVILDKADRPAPTTATMERRT